MVQEKTEVRTEQTPSHQAHTPPPLRIHADTIQGLEHEDSQQQEPSSYKIKVPKASLYGLLAISNGSQNEIHVVS